MLIFDLALLLVHLYIVYWVYRDALARYHRGAPWAVLAAAVPLGGWLFYLLYRHSPLVELDRIEAELFDEAAEEWTDYDTYKANQSAQLFREITSLWRKPEGEGYSPWIRMSRLRELRRQLTPEEQRERAEAQRKKKVEAATLRRERKAARQAKQREAKRAARERQTMAGALGTQYRMSDRRQRAMQRKLEVLEKLKHMPREDRMLEDMIYEMKYVEALQAAREGLAVAGEMGDRQAAITYQAYVERLERLLEEP
jgi:hypothetical protein